MTYKPKWVWVKSHQDNENIITKCNNYVDHLAGEYRCEIETPQFVIFPNSKASLIIAGEIIETNVRHNIIFGKND